VDSWRQSWAPPRCGYLARGADNYLDFYCSKGSTTGLTSDTRALANALGAWIVDSPELQSDLISLLTSVGSQREADRSTGIEGVALEVALNLCHAVKQELLAGEIATEVNRIQKARGERLVFSAERVGHLLKKVGLYTRRLGSAGRESTNLQQCTAV
jgi:hypothetical protein